jgi:ATP-dependent protease ClpP protease subunit
MTPIVLLRGYITESLLEGAWREICFYLQFSEAKAHSLSIVVDSVGGNGTKALEFVRKVKKTGLIVKTKIYHAESAAALIALSFERREIVWNGKLVIHLGSVEIESCDINNDGKIPRSYVETAREFRKAVLNATALPPGALMDTLLATNRLVLTASDCLRLGLVERVVG